MIDKILEKIKAEYSEDRVAEMIQEAKYDFIDAEDIEEYGDIDEAYLELGRGEAEAQVVNEIIKTTLAGMPFIGQIDTNYLILLERLSDHFNITL